MVSRDLTAGDFIGKRATRCAQGTFRAIAVLTVIAAASGGCSRSKPKVELLAVGGNVRLAREPLANGTVTFIPEIPEESGGRPGIARIDPDGSYRVGNANPDKSPGLAPGRYRVTVSSMQAIRSESGEPVFRDRVPAEYADWRRTPWRVDVRSPTDSVNFEIPAAQPPKP